MMLAYKNLMATKIQRALRRTILKTRAMYFEHIYICADNYFYKMRKALLTNC